ncbi:MAG: sialidase family protein, partial [Planctomycetota bacterium]
MTVWAGNLSQQPGIVKLEFIFDKAPFRECHASTIVQSKKGLVAAWFGGMHESNPDVGIWLSRRKGKKWSKPVEVANGIQHDKKRYPCWNPVLFQPKKGPLLLFYKAGPSPDDWWGILMTSDNGGRTWSFPRRLPEDILGPVKNKPVRLPDGVLLCGSSTEDKGWRVHFERTPDLGRSWRHVGPINDGKEFGAIQPTLLKYADGRIQALCRSRQRRITESWSSDGGKTWSEMKATSLPNPNSGIDGVTLKDGRQLLVYNHTPDGRSPLNVAVSNDGKIWKA